MANEKYYNYYKLTGDVAKADIAEYKSKHDRGSILEKMLKDSGAVAFTERSSWGDRPTLVAHLCYPIEHDFGLPSDQLKVIRKDWFNGKQIIIARAKNTSKANREYNKKLDKPVVEANELLKETPKFSEWFITKYKIASEGFGDSTGRGMPLLLTWVGIVNDTILIQVPNKELPVIPEHFEQLTYGQYYDLGNLS